MSPFAEHLIAVRDRLFWKRAFRREQARVLGAIDEAFSRLNPGGPFESSLREDLQAVGRELNKLRQNTIGFLPSKERSPMKKAAWQCESTRRGLDAIRTKAHQLLGRHNKNGITSVLWHMLTSDWIL
jgi:hypothetical protein